MNTSRIMKELTKNEIDIIQKSLSESMLLAQKNLKSLQSQSHTPYVLKAIEDCKKYIDNALSIKCKLS